MNGQIPEWPKGTDCKSAAICFGGSNPPLPICNFIACRRGGTGRRAGLKILWWRHRTGSIPVAGITRMRKTSSCGKMSFCVIGNFVPITQKMLRKDHAAAELNNVANATRRRRRILQAGFFLFLSFLQFLSGI